MHNRVDKGSTKVGTRCDHMEASNASAQCVPFLAHRWPLAMPASSTREEGVTCSMPSLRAPWPVVALLGLAPAGAVLAVVICCLAADSFGCCFWPGAGCCFAGALTGGGGEVPNRCLVVVMIEGVLRVETLAVVSNMRFHTLATSWFNRQSAYGSTTVSRQGAEVLLFHAFMCVLDSGPAYCPAVPMCRNITTDASKHTVAGPSEPLGRVPR